MQFIKFSNFDKNVIIVHTQKKYKLNLVLILIFSKNGIFHAKISIMYFETW